MTSPPRYCVLAAGALIIATGCWFGGVGVTVTVVDPATPSLVAVMLAVEAATPVTNPLPFTLAMLVLSLVPGVSAPSDRMVVWIAQGDAQLTVALTFTVAGDGVTVTVATSCRTSIVAVSARVAVSAMTRAVPGDMAVAWPLPST